MKKLTKKKKRRLLILLLVIIVLGAIKIKIPRFVSPYGTFHYAMKDVMKKSNNIWMYTPLVDTLVIKDSLRNLRFKVQKAYAYDARSINYIYLHYFLPWARLSDYDKLKLFDVAFDYLDIFNILSKVRGVWFSINDVSMSYKIHHRVGIEDEEKTHSIYGTSILYPLPDTLYFTVWGYSNAYIDKRTFRSLPKKERMDFIGRCSDEKEILLGEITFVKSDSIIKENQEYDKDFLFWNL